MAFGEGSLAEVGVGLAFVTLAFALRGNSWIGSSDSLEENSCAAGVVAGDTAVVVAAQWREEEGVVATASVDTGVGAGRVAFAACGEGRNVGEEVVHKIVDGEGVVPSQAQVGGPGTAERG